MQSGQDHGIFIRERRGSKRKGTILYLHGLGESGLCFEETINAPELGAWDHLALDFPGYGHSPWPEVELPIAGLVDFTADWLRSRDPSPVIVVGHSMGGVAGTVLSEEHPDSVRAFLNVEGNVSSGDCGYSSQAASHDRESWLAGRFQDLLEKVRRKGRSDVAHRRYYESFKTCDPRVFHLNSRELVQVSESEEMAGRLKSLSRRMPLLYVGGIPDGVPLRTIDLLEQHDVPRAWIEPAGHWPFLDRPREFRRILTDFLDDLT